jgi:rhodanese-related sulfurtransferase
MVDESMSHTIIYVFLFIMAAWFIYKQFVPVKGLQNLNAGEFENELKQYGNSIQLIDVRELHEFHQSRIAGAVNIPLSQMKQKLSYISKDKPVYLYCRSGMRSKQAAKILRNNGYNRINHLSGGMMVWKGPIAK